MEQMFQFNVKHSIGAAFVVASSFFYATYGVWTVLMGDFFGGYTASGLRSILVLIILLLLAWWLGGFEKIALQKNWKKLVGMSIVSMLIWGPLYWSVLQVGISMALAVNYSAIVLGFLIFGWLIAKESLSITKIISASVGIVGLALVFVPTVTGVIALLPLVAALVSGLAIALNTIFAKQLSYKTTQATIFLWLTSVIANIPLAFILQEPFPELALRGEWFYLVCFAAASVLSSWLLLKGMQYIDAGTAGILGLLEIVFGVAFGVFLFQEKLEWVAVIGVLMIIAAAAYPYMHTQKGKSVVIDS